MPRPKSLKPSYCLHRSSGRAFVKIDGKPVYLGMHGTQESRDAYDRVIGEWIARGRMPAPRPATSGTEPRPFKIIELIDAYWTHAQSYYVDPDGQQTSEVDTLKQALCPIKRLYGDTPAASIGPKALRAVREVMIAGEILPVGLGVKGCQDVSRAGPWSRKHINKQVSRLRGMFKWGAAHELVPASVYHSLATLEPLKRGRTTARETAPIKPVALSHVQAVLPFLSRQLAAVAQLQLLTGARGGELLIMRTRDIDTTSEVWTYTPSRHKTQHHEIDRVIRIGPKGRRILEPFLKADASAFIFSPAEAEAERRAELAQARKTPLSCGTVAGENVKDNPDRRPGDRYTKDSYARAVARACDLAFPLSAELARGRVVANGRKLAATRAETDAEWKTRLGADWQKVKAWQKSHRFHPHQLRHSAATFIAQTEGVELARIILGHRHLSTTEIYAEADQKKAEQTMMKIG